MVKQYRKKPVVIQAIQYDGFYTGEINDFCGNKVREPVGEHYLEIETLEGVMRANAGDFLICGVEGEFYPCKPDIFMKTYEEVSDAQQLLQPGIAEAQEDYVDGHKQCSTD